MVLSSIPLDDACCCCCVDVLCLLEGLVLMLLLLLLLLLLHRGEFDPLPPEEYVTLRLVLLFIYQLSSTIISSDSTSVSSEAERACCPLAAAANK